MSLLIGCVRELAGGREGEGDAGIADLAGDDVRDDDPLLRFPVQNRGFPACVAEMIGRPSWPATVSLK